MNHRIRRGGVVVAAVLMALTVGVQPVVGTVVKVTGKVGYWAVLQSSTGSDVTCFYDSAKDLYRINVVAPVTVKGRYSYQTWVGWRMKILRTTDLVSYKTIYTSPLQKRKADDLVGANFGSSGWEPPGQAAASGWYKVRIVILFYKPGSKTTVEGKVIFEYNYYWVYRSGGSKYVRANNCIWHHF